MAYSIVTNTDCRSNIGESPKAALHKVYALLFEVLEFLWFGQHPDVK
jgi:hypothetical protein